MTTDTAAATAGEQAGTVGRSVARAAIIIMLGNVFSRVLGFVRDAVIAGVFGGHNPQLDGYFTAYRVQTSIYDLLISGVISAAFIPVFSAIRDDREEFARVGGTILTITVLVTAAAMGALELFAHDAIAILAQGSQGDRASVIDAGTQALRLISPAVVFLGLSGVLTALLYSRQRAVFPAFSPAIFNLAIVVAALGLHRVMQVNSLVAGVVGGAVAQVLLQGYGLRDVRLRLTLALRDPYVRKIIRLIIPVFLGLIVTQAQVWIDLYFAHLAGTNSLNYLTFATRIYQFPLGLAATAISLAILPTLSTTQGPEYRQTLARGLAITLLLIVPAVIACSVLAAPVIALAFQHHSFTAADTANTADALRYYAPGLAFAALDQLLIFAFYARHDTKTPVIVGVVATFAYLIVAVLTLHVLSFRGLALADSAKQIAHASILYVLVWRRYGRLEGLELRGAVGKILISGTAMALLCYLLLRLAGPRWTTGFLHLLVFVPIAGSLGLLLYGILLHWLGVSELTLLVERIRSRLGRAA